MAVVVDSVVAGSGLEAVVWAVVLSSSLLEFRGAEV